MMYSKLSAGQKQLILYYLYFIPNHLQADSDNCNFNHINFLHKNQSSASFKLQFKKKMHLFFPVIIDMCFF